jgi:peptidoglycan hydrolase-like protein with peptidoglycan-binding domain
VEEAVMDLDATADQQDPHAVPEQTDNSVRPEDGAQDVDQDALGWDREDGADPLEEWWPDLSGGPDIAGGGGATAESVINVARSQLGFAEDPPGSNRSPYGKWYGMDGQPWCAMFVSWCADRAGAAALIPKHAFTPAGAAWFTERGQWGKTPRLGAVVYFRWPSMGRIAHVGIVESVRADGTVVAIEGNTDSAGGRTGGRVMRQVRRANIAGYGYPAYASRAAVAAAAAPATGGALDVDGELGPLTWKALQRVLGVPADGEPGPVTYAALQRRVGSTPDGELGPRTVKALQLRVGVTPDGEWGPRTTQALQRALNAGTF